MVQNQLLEYISSQLKLGVSRDAIKTALATAGWPSGDVEDTLKKAEDGSGKPPASAATAPAGVSAVATVKAASAPSSIRVSDLVSASSAAGAVSIGKSSPVKDLSTKISGSSMVSGAMSSAKKFPIMKIIGILLIIGFGAAAGYFYFQNTTLSGKVASLGTTSASVAAQVGSLTSQVQLLSTSNTALSAQVASLTAENQMLTNLISFVATPAAGGAATSSVAFSGTLGGGKPTYSLTTSYGVVIYVQNSKDAAVIAVLKPLLTSTSSVTLAGTHVLGSQFLSVTSVNGAPVSPPQAPAVPQHASSTQ